MVGNVIGIGSTIKWPPMIRPLVCRQTERGSKNTESAWGAGLLAGPGTPVALESIERRLGGLSWLQKVYAVVVASLGMFLAAIANITSDQP